MSYFNSNVTINLMLALCLVNTCRLIADTNYVAAVICFICAGYWLVKKLRKQEQN